MSVIWIPNVSEGRDERVIGELVDAVSDEGVRVLDVHSDVSHNRSVITATGDDGPLVAGAVALAHRAKELIDLDQQRGTHPRVGVLDVCPFVPLDVTMSVAVQLARAGAERIAHEAEIPVYLYGEAARRPATRSLPDIRRGGLEALIQRADRDLPPDIGSREIDPRVGVVCVGARGPLIAFNVWLDAPLDTARRVAQIVRSASVRALGMQMASGETQVSMNLIDPETTGIDDVVEEIEGSLTDQEGRIVATEIVGLVPERFLPNPDAKAARLLREPGRSLESELAKS